MKGGVVLYRGRRLRVHHRDGLRQITWVYGWRDVVAWPLTDFALVENG